MNVKYHLEAPLLNFDGFPRVPLLNFEGGS